MVSVCQGQNKIQDTRYLGPFQVPNNFKFKWTFYISLDVRNSYKTKIRQQTCSEITLVLEVPEWLSELSVGDSGSGHDLRVVSSSPAWGSTLTVEPASDSLSLSLKQTNEPKNPLLC